MRAFPVDSAVCCYAYGLPEGAKGSVWGRSAREATNFWPSSNPEAKHGPVQWHFTETMEGMLYWDYSCWGAAQNASTIDGIEITIDSLNLSKYHSQVTLSELVKQQLLHWPRCKKRMIEQWIVHWKWFVFVRVGVQHHFEPKLLTFNSLIWLISFECSPDTTSTPP